VIDAIAPQMPAARRLEAAHAAAGSPYLAELIGLELAETDARTDERRGPSGGAAEARRLARLSPRERAIAEVVALAEGAATFEQLRAVTAVPSVQLQSALRALEDARVVRALPAANGDAVFAFYHQRLRDAAEVQLATIERRALHRRFASWFQDASRRAGDPALHAGALAWHWREAGDHAIAARWAMVAADAAHAQLAWRVAADWYGRGRAGGAPPHRARGGRALALGADPIRARAGRADSRFLAGNLADAARELLALGELDRERAEHWRVRAAEAYVKLGELDRGLALLDGILERRGRSRARTRLGSSLRAAGVAARLVLARDIDGDAAAAGDPALANVYRVIASFLSTPYPIESFEYVLRALELAERTGDHGAHATGLAMIAGYLAAGTLGRFGDRVIGRATELAAARGTPYARMVVAGAAGMLATSRGDWGLMRRAHGDGAVICRQLGLERSWEASFLRGYWALGELYAGAPDRALALLADPAEATDDLFGRALLRAFRGRALCMTGELDAAAQIARELDRSAAAGHGMAAIYRDVLAGERALAAHDWPRAKHIAGQLGRAARTHWLTAMPAVPAMVEVIAATAELGLAAAGTGDRAAAGRARAIARTLYRRGHASFYAPTALRLWSQAETLLGDAGGARTRLARAAEAATKRGGELDRLAIAALPSRAIDPGPLAAAVAWATGGVVRVR
jgi:hypothetical protein